MTKITLLEELKKFTETALRDLLQPYQRESKMIKNSETGEQERVYEGEELQSVKVFLNGLPDEEELKTAPFIFHQIIIRKDFINERRQYCSTAMVRTCFCAHGKNGVDSGGYRWRH